MEAPNADRDPSRPVNLAVADPFALGNVSVIPSRLALRSDRGDIAIEPRVMQVLLALHDAGGNTVSRDLLMARCWPGMTVGDDSINRAIAELRRALRETGAAASVETVPRIGYRLDHGEAETVPAGSPAEPRQTGPATGQLDRRKLIIGGATIAVGLAGAAWWQHNARRRDPALEALVASGRQALREQLPDRNAKALADLREAAKRAPDDAEVLGLLALAWRDTAEFAPEAQAADAARSCETTARRALAIDPKEGNALAALATLQPFYGDWGGSEQRLLKVLEIAPGSIPIISHLTAFYQSAGYLAESQRRNDQALQLDPLSPVFQFRGALKLWIDNRLQAADAQIDRALELWPRHPAVWNTRLMLYAFTGRAAAGLQFAANDAARPPLVPQPAIKLWRAVLESLSGDRAARTTARETAIATTMGGVGSAHTALMYLSYAGELDAAFEVANGYFLRRGRYAASGQIGARKAWVTDQAWRRTMMLFTPAMKALRRDPRFAELMNGMGLTEFWQARAVRPDYSKYDKRSD